MTIKERAFAFRQKDYKLNIEGEQSAAEHGYTVGAEDTIERATEWLQELLIAIYGDDTQKIDKEIFAFRSKMKGEKIKMLSEYTTYCTEKQTDRALKLGAPVKIEYITEGHSDLIDAKIVHKPTTQQMIAWLREEKNINILTTRDVNDLYSSKLTFPYNKNENWTPLYFSHSQSELAAINAALDYLERGGEL